EPCDQSQAFAFKTGLLANTITLAGCGQWPNAVPDVLQYDTVGNAWSTVGTLNDNRRNQAGTVIGAVALNKMYILGGYGEASGFIDPLTTSEVGKPAAAADTEPNFSPALPRPSSGGAVTTN